MREQPVLETAARAADATAPALAADASIEVVPKSADPETAAALARLLGCGAAAYVPSLPNANFDDVTVACRNLAAAGLRPVPHLAARAAASRGAMADRLGRLSDMGVDAAFLIAGDAKRPVGPFQESLQVLESGLLQRYGFRSLGIAGHPEGHPYVDSAALWRALALKAAYARESGLSAWIVTQFAFDAAPLTDWLRAYRDSGIGLPVRVGLAGPTKLGALLAYALRCGVGASAKALMAQPGVALRLAGQWTPDALFAALARSHAADATSPISGVHLFPFGGVRRGAAWIAAQRAAAPAEQHDKQEHEGSG